MLKVSNLSIDYEGFLAVQGVSFEIKKQSSTALIGFNGSGKTSILKAISGVNKDYKGDIFFKDKNLKNIPVKNIVKEKLILVPEGREVFSNLTVKENLLVGGHTVKGDIKSIYKSVLNNFNVLKSMEKKLAGKLSGGQQQIVALARAMMSSPEFLLVDEPTMGLTPKNSKIIMDFLFGLKKKGITILIASSTFKVGQEGFDKKIIIENGKIKKNNS